MPSKRHPRARPRRAPRAQPPLTTLQLARVTAMLTNPSGVVTRSQVQKHLHEQGVDVSHSTVRAVLTDRFRNPDVERAFCELTGTDAATMFPDPPPAAAPPTSAQADGDAARVRRSA